jgi:death-on-curing protein
MSKSPKFLTRKVVLEMHHRLIVEFGGLPGVRDEGLLDSALAQPMGTFAGDFLHADIFAMAAAYLFHIVMNHPFVDGNKRTGLNAAISFLRLNGHPIDNPTARLFELTMAVSKGRQDKDGIAPVLREIASV